MKIYLPIHEKIISIQVEKEQQRINEEVRAARRQAEGAASRDDLQRAQVTVIFSYSQIFFHIQENTRRQAEGAASSARRFTSFFF